MEIGARIPQRVHRREALSRNTPHTKVYGPGFFAYLARKRLEGLQFVLRVGWWPLAFLQLLPCCHCNTNIRCHQCAASKPAPPQPPSGSFGPFGSKTSRSDFLFLLLRFLPFGTNLVRHVGKRRDLVRDHARRISLFVAGV